MKKLFRLFLIAAILFIVGSAKSFAQTVYMTDNGKKFHAKNCTLVKTGKKGIELSEAKKKGLEPCKNCKADAIKPENKKATSPKSKK
jgi:NOL1/NOP2/fmu family ribosome biogenesis protein